MQAKGLIHWHQLNLKDQLCIRWNSGGAGIKDKWICIKIQQEWEETWSNKPSESPDMQSHFQHWSIVENVNKY